MSKEIISILAGLGLAFAANASVISSKSNAEISALAKDYASQSAMLGDAQTNANCFSHFQAAGFMLKDIPFSIEQYGREYARKEVEGASFYTHAAVLDKCNLLNEIQVFERNLNKLHSSF